MTKRYISVEDFVRAFRELSEDNQGEKLAYALYETFTIKRKSPGSIQCANHECNKEVLYSDAKGWIRIPQVQRMNGRKQWEDLHGEELYFCSVKCEIAELEFSTSLPY